MKAKMWYGYRRIIDHIEQYPGLYVRLARGKYRNQPNQYNKIIKPDSRLLIEGYPRSANSFARKAFRLKNDPNILTGHMHSHAQVLKAIEWNVPTLVLIRAPDEAIVSLVAFLMMQKASVFSAVPGERSNKELQLLVKYWTLRYTVFYTSLMSAMDDFIVGEFSRVVKDFGAILDKVNNRYGTSFGFVHGHENVEHLKRSAGEYVFPSDERELVKGLIRSEYLSTSNERNRLAARTVYETFVLGN